MASSASTRCGVKTGAGRADAGGVEGVAWRGSRGLHQSKRDGGPVDGLQGIMDPC